LDAANDPARAYDEGLKYLHGDPGFPQDPARANELIYRAADGGYAPAMTKLGEMYYVGAGIGKDANRARKWFEHAAAAGNGEAMYNLGEMSRYNEAGLRKRDARYWCQGASLARYDGFAERPFDRRVLEGRDGRMAATATAMMPMPAAVMPMPAAVMAMAIPIRIMPPVIAAVVPVIAAVVTIMAAAT
jgi:TPR repeat protein